MLHCLYDLLFLPFSSMFFAADVINGSGDGSGGREDGDDGSSGSGGG